MKILRWLTSFILYVFLAFFLTAITTEYFAQSTASDGFNLIALIINIVGIAFAAWYIVLILVFNEHKGYKVIKNKDTNLYTILLILFVVISGVLYFIYNIISMRYDSTSEGESKKISYFFIFIVLAVVINICAIFFDTCLLLNILKAEVLTKEAKAALKEKNIDSSNQEEINKMIKIIQQKYRDKIKIKTPKMKKQEDLKNEDYWKN